MKRYILTLCAFFSMIGMYAQDMKTLFIAMPDQYIPQLETAWRKDLVDLYESGKEARLQNTMTGYSQLSKLTPDYLLLKVTERSTVEMKMLPLVNNTHIIAMVTTIEGPVADSRIDFFSTEWQPLASSDLFTPVSSEWFIKENIDKNSDEYKDALARLDIDLVQYQLSPDNQTLTATYTTPLYLTEPEQKKIMPFLKETPKVYVWEKFHFK